jgi:hypothetical protein
MGRTIHGISNDLKLKVLSSSMPRRDEASWRSGEGGVVDVTDWPAVLAPVEN